MGDFVCVTDFEKAAKPSMALGVASYFYSGADEEFSMRENVLALQRLVNIVDTSTM